MSRVAQLAEFLGRPLEDVFALEVALQTFWEEALKARGDFGIPEERFLRHLATVVPTPSVSALDRLRAGDLYLCCACAEGNPGALQAFERMLPEVADSLHRSGHPAPLVREVLQDLRTRLLVPTSGESPRILLFGGRGPLHTWLRVAAVRIALNLQRSVRRHVEVDEGQPDFLMPSPDPELSFLKERYREDCQQALREALAALPTPQQAVLRLHFLDGLTIDQIGTLYKIHRATAARRLVQARLALLKGVQTRLAERLRLDPEECKSVLDLLRSQLHVSLARALGS